MNATEVKAVEEMVNTFNKTTKELSQLEAEKVKTQFLESLKNNYFNIQTAQHNLDLGNIKALSVSGKEENYTVLVVPIIGSEYNPFSSIIFIYNSNLELVTYQETHILKSKTNNFEFTTYDEGEKTSQEVSEIEYVSNDVFLKGVQGIKEFGNPVPENRTRNCLMALLGINGTAAAVAIKVCGASCKFPTKITVPICAACIGAFAKVGQGSIPAVAGCFLLG